MDSNVLADDPKSGQILKETRSLVARGIFVLHSKEDQTCIQYSLMHSGLRWCYWCQSVSPEWYKSYTGVWKMH